MQIDNLSQQSSTVQRIENEAGGYQYKALTGMGFVYKKNLDFVDTILKKQVVQWWLDENPEPKEFTMNFDWGGTNTSLKDAQMKRFFDDQILPYDIFENSYAPNEDWNYETDSMENIIGKQRTAAMETITIKYVYLNLHHSYYFSIKIMDATNKPRKQKLLLTYNDNGFLIEKKLTENNKTIWTQTLIYGATGRLLKTERWAVENNKVPTIFSIKNEYYSMADLPGAIL